MIDLVEFPDRTHDMSISRSPRRSSTAHPADVIRWAADQFGADGLVVTASFEDAVLVHVAATAVPGIEIVLLDTQYLFAETHWFAESCARASTSTCGSSTRCPTCEPDNLWQTDTDGCCHVRKVEPLQRALAGKQAWLTGVRRVDGPTRANAPVAAYDVGRGLVKVNPLATLTDDDMALYEQLHDLPRNPLTRARLPQHRLLAVHPTGRTRRGQACRPLGRQRQDRMRAAHMSATLDLDHEHAHRPPRRPHRRGDHHHPRGRHRVREPGAAVQRRQGQRRAAAPRRARVRARPACRSR